MLAFVLAIGVDLSAEDTRTWMASLRLRPDGANLVALDAKVGNARIVEAAATADKLGIDCPFGWPVAFLEFVNEHMSGSVSARSGRPIDWRRQLAFRETDRFVTKQTGLRPLSVAADRIAHAAMRCAALLAELSRAGVLVDRSGVHGTLVEVYPAASLRRWHLSHRGYKRVQNTAHLDQLVTELCGKAPWLHLGEHETTCRSNDDAFDAVVAGLSAAAAALGLATPPPDDASRAVAKREGWIALPDDSLATLLGAVAAGRPSRADGARRDR